MPHKHKKNNALKNGSPKAEKKQLAPESPVEGSKVVPSTNYKEIHQNETDALRSIYADDFEDVEVRPAAWQQSSDVAFKLHLKSSSNPDVGVLFLVELPTTYPKTVPNLALEGLDDLRRGAKSRIENIVETKPKTLLGYEMIYELAVSIQEVLEDAAQAKAEDKDLPSLEEERIVQEAAAIHLAEQQRQEEVKKQEAESAEEERALKQLLDDKIKQRQRVQARVSRRKSKSAAMDGVLLEEPAEDSPGAISFDPPLAMNDNEDRPLIFRSVFGKTLISSTHDKETFTVRPIVAENKIRAPLIVLKEIFLDEKGPETPAFRQQMRSSEDKLEGLKNLRHPNLVDFIGFKIHRPLDAFDSYDNTWRICTLFEFANKGSLLELLDMVGTIQVENIRTWMIQLLQALEYFHGNGLVHGSIHCGRVFLFRNASGDTIVKLAAGVEEALPNPSGEKWSLTTSQSPFWLPPELTQDNAQPGAKADIWEMGIILLQMGFGKDVLHRYTSSNALIAALDLSMPLEDLIREIFKPDPKKRPTAFQLQPSEFFRVDSPLLDVANSSNSMSLPKRPRLDSQGALSAFSRYANDFDEAGRLGKGGFGQVVKARNKLDGRFYAVKKISHNSAGALKDTLSEIMLLSRLNHPFVVRYYTAWLEEDVNDAPDEAVSSTEGDPASSQDNNVEFGYSTGGLDFISSSGYPKVEFGYDSDEPNDPATTSGEDGPEPTSGDYETTGVGKELERTRSGSQSRPVTTTLYIQMEYCEKHTLRDLIRNGLYDDIDQSWRLFRQILDGLSHIHSHGIIHRDLKPDNIFIDVGNNPRIGDFGLATSGQFTTAVRASATQDVGGNFTRSIGTTYYVAPEMKSGSTAQYNEKVDMYSLGVIFFEMCYPLKTAMERDHTLQEIREKSHILPATFQHAEKAVQGEIINSLLSHRPSERPSAPELLQGGKIPLQIEEESFRRAIMGLLSDPNSPDYKKILEAIFSQPPKKFEDIAWDMDSRGTPAANEMHFQSLVKEKLASIFRRHGAVQVARQALFPRSEHYNAGLVKLLDSSGNLVQLPYDLTLPNARSIPRQDSSLERTFSFGTVYRESPHGGEPKSHGEADFDIISQNTLDISLKEAEVIKVLDEIIEDFPHLKSAQMCFHINHSDLLEAIMGFCRINIHQRPIVKEVISKLNIGQWTMQKIRSELRSPTVGVASTSLDDLARFDFRDNPDKTLKKLKTIMDGTEYVDRLAPIFARINSLITYIKAFGVKRKVYINPLSSLNDKFFRGSILFQCIFDTKRRDVFAAGGRYDALIKEFRPKVLSSRSQSHAVGFNLGWEKLSLSTLNYLKGSSKAFLKHAETDTSGFWKTRRCDVLVASFDATVLRTVGIKIIQELWANEISAELAVDASSLEEVLSRYKDDNHSWIVIAKQDSKDRGLKIKSLVRKEEFEVRASELVSWLRGEMRHRSQREGSSESSKPSKTTMQQDTNVSVSERAANVRVMTPQHRSKKTNRRNIIESALVRCRELADKSLDGPIVAVDIKDDILDEIRNTRLADPDSWRNVIHRVQLSDRRYLQQVHELLLDLCNEGRNTQDGQEGYNNAFIYNYRTGLCIYYDLGTV